MSVRKSLNSASGLTYTSYRFVFGMCKVVDMWITQFWSLIQYAYFMNIHYEAHK